MNTTDSRVELSWDAEVSPTLRRLPQETRSRILTRLDGRLVGGAVTVVASEFRSQRRNRDAARARMAALLREAVAPPATPRRPTRPTRASKQRRLDAKKHRSQIKRFRRVDE